MAFEQKDFTGALFKNKNKTSTTHPEYTGTLKIRGEEFKLSAWIKPMKSGESFMSLAVAPLEKESQPSSKVVLDNDIPF